MAARYYGHRVYDCGCKVSLSATGRHMGLATECPDAIALMNSMIRDKRPQTQEVSAEWRATWDNHFGESNG